MEYENKKFELSDLQVDNLLQYAPAFNEEQSENIKHKFYSKTSDKHKRRSMRKTVFAVILAAALLSISVLAYAGVFDLSRIYNMVFGKNGEYLSQYGSVMDGGNESDGIKLNLISAIKDDTKLIIFFSLTDLSDSNRLGDSMEIREWHIDQGTGGNCSIVDYNKDTQTATFMITSMGASTNKTATMSIKSFLEALTFKKDLVQKEIDINTILSDHIAKTIPYSKVKGDWFSGGFAPNSKYSNHDDSLNNLNMLLQDELSIQLTGIDWAEISNMGFTDNEFHIQTKRKTDSFSNIMSMNLLTENGDVAFGSETDIGYGDHEGMKLSGLSLYDEFIFQNIHSISQLEGLMLSMDVAEYGAYHSGDWIATFKVPEPMTKLDISVNRNLILSGHNVFIDKMNISPLGISIKYNSQGIKTEGNTKDTAFVTYKDGTVINLQFISNNSTGDEQTLGFSYPILEIEQIASVNINGIEISIE